MNPVDLSNIDPVTLAAAVQLIQKAQADQARIDLPQGEYIGQLKDGVPHGRGTLHYKNTDESKRMRYEGDVLIKGPNSRHHLRGMKAVRSALSSAQMMT